MAGVQQKILVVEDDPDLLRIMMHTLSSAGYRAMPAYGGEDALRKIQRDRYDLILTDLAMPKMSGVELIEILKRDPATAQIPVVAVTAYWMDSFGDAANDVGCDGHLVKPFRSADLLRVVGKYLPTTPPPPARS
jgi:two-component system, cell cycle response regulator DivK